MTRDQFIDEEIARYGYDPDDALPDIEPDEDAPQCDCGSMDVETRIVCHRNGDRDDSIEEWELRICHGCGEQWER